MVMVETSATVMAVLVELDAETVRDVGGRNLVDAVENAVALVSVKNIHVEQNPANKQ